MPYTRREFLTIGVETMAGFAVNRLIPPETPNEWNPITVKQGDTLWSICNFYNVSNRQKEICRVNQLITPDRILAEQTLWFPISADRLETPFNQFILYGLYGNRQCNHIPMTNNRQVFESYGSETILYSGQNLPYVLSGHSSPDRNFKDQFPFDSLLRKLLHDHKLKIPFWLQRTGGNSYIHGVLRGDLVGWSPDDRNTNHANSRNLVLRTCAVETPAKGDELFCLAPIVNYHSYGPEN